MSFFEIKHLDQPGFDERRFGRKAANLSVLSQRGFAVPKAFGIVFNTEGDEWMLHDWGSEISQIGGFPVAVRSSGIQEDLEGASFAGQYESYLDVGSVEAFVEAVQKCMASAHSSKVAAYLKQNNLEADSKRLSVLVQKMVAPEYAGVAFSIDPTTGKEEHALVEACRGLGERLVSGHVNPSRFVLNLKDSALVSYEKGDENVTFNAGQQSALIGALLNIQALFGQPQDIEWAIDSQSQLWILQSRPVTALRPRQDVDEFTNADFRDGGVSARVCCQLMFSIYRDVMMRSMQDYFVSLKLLSAKRPSENWIDMFYGRPYWNTTVVKRQLSQIPGFHEARFDQDLGIQKNYGVQGPQQTPNSLRYILPIIPVAFAVKAAFAKTLKKTFSYAKKFLPQYEHFLAQSKNFAGLTDVGFNQLALQVLDFQFATENDYFLTIYNNSTAQTDFKEFLDKLDRATQGKTQILSLISGLGNISHLKVQAALLKLCEALRQNPTTRVEERNRFLQEFGFHADAELDLMCPRWSEVPSRVDELVDALAKAGVKGADPAQSLVKQQASYAQTLEEILGRVQKSVLSRLRFQSAFFKHLDQVRTYLVRREEMREHSSQAYALVRYYALESARRLVKAGKLQHEQDFFHLDVQEWREILNGTQNWSDLSKRIAVRAKFFAGYRNFAAPNELGKDIGLGTAPAADFAASLGSGSHRVVKGLGCSAGLLTAKVRVINDIGESSQLEAGEILVTRFTDPGWTPVLGIASGVITEVGGLLSHAAVIGREYGIPAILNLPRATQIFKTGQRVRMDGSSGTVEFLDS